MAPTKSGAYCTLLTNDNYLCAALTLAQSLTSAGASYPLCILVTPEVTQAALSQLDVFFTSIIPVSSISGKSPETLEMMGRADLHATFTKFHLWNQTQFSRVVFFDADVLVLQNVDELFSLPDDVPFAASPELGFPDVFNSGMMVIKPSQDVFSTLTRLAGTEASFDGGDQGLLNQYFGDGTSGHPAHLALTGGQLDPSRGPAWYRLSYTYNMEMHKVYRMYVPAVLRYRSQHKALHFIGKDKPWHFEDGKVDMGENPVAYQKFYAEKVEQWWAAWRTAKERLATKTQ